MAWLIELGFCSLIALVLYIYAGYPILLTALAKIRTKFRGKPDSQEGPEFTPTVSLIIAAYNEEQHIAQKLKNSLALDYPRNKLEIIVVSDGSRDRTANIVREYSDRGVHLVDLSHNVGKAFAQNEAVKTASGDTLLFTDANVALQRDAVRKLVRHFADDGVGCVVGKVTYLNEGETGVGEGEGLYWRYELFLRHKESEVGNLVAGSGPIIAVRRVLFNRLDPAVSEDFFLPMKGAIKGYRTVYEPAAVSSERLFQISPHDMFKTRVRTITLDTRSVFLCRAILNPFRYPLHAWGLISHKVLRWLVPYFLIVIFAANALLLGRPLYHLTLALQVTFYGLAVAGFLWERRGKPPRVLSIPFAFCLVNGAAMVGVMRFALGKKSGQWQPVR